ncbi:MAG: radical SAM protein [Syntrophus sp. (in: bacteria)]|nr:radical SAM protein [Syntrophus sp. (in: bacteria)]
MILIYPPVVKPSEPPPGIAKLLGACNAHGIRCRLVDANIEGILSLLACSNKVPSDTWGIRAVKNVSKNLAALKRLDAYRKIDQYTRAVKDINRVLEMAGADRGVSLSLANYQNKGLSPVKSADLIRAAEEPENNPFYPYFSARLGTLLEEEQTFLVGFSLNYLSQALCTFAMIGFLKQRYPGIRIVIGGGLVTSWMRRPGWNNPFLGLVDLCVAGPGEGPLLALAGAAGESTPHCLPDYGTLPMKDYLSPGVILPYNSSVGCYWNRCAFCPERAEQNPYVRVPKEAVMSDLSMLVERIKPSLIHIVDNAISPALMGAFALNPPGAPWYGFSRITEDLADLDFCLALKESGCLMLKVGLESGDQGVIDAMEKGIDLDIASRALKNLKKAGIGTYVYLLFGTPAETAAEALKTLHFTARHADVIDFLNVAVFNLPAHGAEAMTLETSPFYEGDLSLYRAFIHPKGWNRRQVRIFLDREFKRNPSISAIIRKDPPVFTSNHAPFFLNSF